MGRCHKGFNSQYIAFRGHMLIPIQPSHASVISLILDLQELRCDYGSDLIEDWSLLNDVKTVGK